MKTVVFQVVALVCSLLFSGILPAAVVGGNVMGIVTDPDTRQPVSDITIIFDCHGNQLAFTTDESGRYYADNIPAGTYTVIVSFMNKYSKLEGFKVMNDETKELNLDFNTAIEMDSFLVIAPKLIAPPLPPIINPFEPDPYLISGKSLKETPITKLSDAAQIVPGIVEEKGSYFVKGARAGGLTWYIDGIKLMGEPNVPMCGIESFKAYTGFIPAKYGDVNGGVIVIETRSVFTE